MGYRSVRKALGEYNAYVFYLDEGAVDLPIIKDRTSIMPGSEAHDLSTLDMWILNSDFQWEYCPWKNGQIGGASGEVTKAYVDSQDETYYNNAINYFKANGGIKYVETLPTSNIQENTIYAIDGGDAISFYVYRNNNWITMFSSQFSVDKWIQKHTGTGVAADFPYTKPEVQNLIAAMKNILVVDAEPTTPMKNTIYYIGPDTFGAYEVILYDSMLNKIDLGTSAVDFSEYQKKIDTDLITSNKIIVSAINELCEKNNNKQDKEPSVGTLNTTATTIVGAINELVDNPTTKLYGELGNKTLIKAIQDCTAGSFAAAYPVGSIYLSVGIDPNTLGSDMVWERISGQFLLGATGTTDSGDTGGSSTATLTVDNLPSHKHVITIDNQSVSYTMPSGTASVNASSSTITTEVKPYTDNESKQHKHDASCSEVGSGTAFDIMPPYLKVDIWKRIS